MPRIFDNIELNLIDGLSQILKEANSADFCIGYFHLRGWEKLAALIDKFRGTEDSCCRILVGMQRPPEEQMRKLHRAIKEETFLDGPTLVHLRREIVESFKEQIEFGVPTLTAEKNITAIGPPDSSK